MQELYSDARNTRNLDSVDSYEARAFYIRGKVEKAWVGQLDDSGQKQVQSQLSKIAHIPMHHPPSWLCLTRR
jgi:hypothetical protein